MGAPLRSPDDLQAGDHACLLFDSDDERMSAIGVFVSDGLLGGDKVYVLDRRAEREIVDSLRDMEIDAWPYLATGQLQLRQAGDVYLSGGAFDPDGIVGLVREQSRLAQREGYRALRIAEDMSWALQDRPGCERLLEFERKVEDVVRERGAVMLCEYDRRRFGEDLLRGALDTHPMRAARGAEVLLDSAILNVARVGSTLRLAGEVDVSNSDELSAALAAVAAGGGDLRLDLGELFFIDVAGLRVLRDTAEALGERGRRLVLRSTPGHVEKVMGIIGLDRLDALSLEH